MSQGAFTDRFIDEQGVAITYYGRLVEHPKAVVQITHGLGEYAILSMVNVAIVPTWSAIGAGSMSSCVPPTMETRAGGRCSATPSTCSTP